MSLPTIPSTAAELENLVRDGVLVEGTSVDFKAGLASGEKANRSLAIDLAAFSVQGGLIVVGVSEVDGPGGRTLEPSPILLSGLNERISTVGTSRVDPAIAVTVKEMPTVDGLGYLLVLVPASPAAPHQVGGFYRGRSDSTNYILTDADVRRIQAERRRRQRDIDRELEDVVRRDPTSPQVRRQAHLFVVARPELPSSPTMFQERVGRDWQKWIRANLLGPRQLPVGFSPDLPDSTARLVRRPDGWAAVSGDFNPERFVPTTAREVELLELEVDEDGRLRLFCARGSDEEAADQLRWAMEALIAGLTWRVLRAAAVIADATNYYGNWDVGVALTNARGIRSLNLRTMFRTDANPFAADEYRSTVSTTHAELTDARAKVLQRLVGRLNRALNDDAWPLPDFDAP